MRSHQFEIGPCYLGRGEFQNHESARVSNIPILRRRECCGVEEQGKRLQ